MTEITADQQELLRVIEDALGITYKGNNSKEDVEKFIDKYINEVSYFAESLANMYAEDDVK